MKPKLRIALALALLVTLVSTVAANAAKPSPSEPSLSVGWWTVDASKMVGAPYDGQYELGVWANEVTVNNVRKYEFRMVVVDENNVPVEGGVMTVTPRRAPFVVSWTLIKPSVAGTYTATLSAVPLDPSAAALSESLSFTIPAPAE